SLCALANAEVETTIARAAAMPSNLFMSQCPQTGETSLQDAARVGELLVRRVPAPDQDLDERIVEQVTAVRAELQQRFRRERDRRRRLGDDDVGAVLLQLGARREVGHLADRRARAELRDLLAVTEDLDL